ncbi:Transmembrane epididymal protein 1-like [Heracleum sosnowskyi]|uniref:Transmembrane epididymal protein 1-like n=1 Tax=Heracleum sosnowskyi TaxID=360622 RepID=A0AAD8J1W7_9APIA|nr:Transmembrane epididymal protein 1-like [Heracleum sosnowskyi]
MAVVELNDRFGDLTMNIIVRMLAGKRYFGKGGNQDKDSSRFQKAIEDFMHLVGLFMVSDAVPLLGWIDLLRGYKGKMKKTAKELEHVLGSWVKEHRHRRETSSITESEQDFIHIMLSLMNDSQSAEITDTAIKGTCLPSLPPLHRPLTWPAEAILALLLAESLTIELFVFKFLSSDRVSGFNCVLFISEELIFAQLL